MVDRRDGVQVPRLGLLLPPMEVESAGPGEFDHLVALARAAEASGFDSVWVHDGPTAGGPGRAEAAPLEPYALLGALAVRTDRVALAVLPDGPPVRHPSLMAKIVTGLDVVSHGRAVLSLGVGPATDPASMERLVEELGICRALFTEEAPTVTGHHYRITRAVNRPRPVRPGGIPLVVVTDRIDALRVAGDGADAVVLTGDPAPVAEVVDGRIGGHGDRSDNPAPRWGRPVVLWRGTFDARDPSGADRAVGRLNLLAEAGVGGFVVDLGEGCDPETVARFGGALAPVVARTGAPGTTGG